jgi:hypothetical protein
MAAKTRVFYPLINGYKYIIETRTKLTRPGDIFNAQNETPMQFSAQALL